MGRHLPAPRLKDAETRGRVWRASLGNNISSQSFVPQQREPRSQRLHAASLLTSYQQPARSRTIGLDKPAGRIIFSPLHAAVHVCARLARTAWDASSPRTGSRALDRHQVRAAEGSPFLAIVSRTTRKSAGAMSRDGDARSLAGFALSMGHESPQPIVTAASNSTSGRSVRPFDSYWSDRSRALSWPRQPSGSPFPRGENQH